MSDVAICAEGLGKRYRVAGRGPAYTTLRETLASTARRSLRALQHRPQAGFGGQEFWALRDVSFAVARGEVVGIIGRNGAGKSTLLKVLSRVTRPTTGQARIGGRIGSLLEVGTGFHPELSGRENIYLNGAILGMGKSEIERNFEAIIDFAEVEHFLDTPVKHYSSGMYMRLAFSIAAHLEPEILVVDEVLAVGDAVFQKKCLGKMGNVAREGRTVLLVSHNMPMILALCDRVLLLQAGRVVSEGMPATIVRQYLQGEPAAGLIPLDQRLDRSGDGSATLVSLKVESADEADGVVRSSSRLKVTLGYQSLAPLRRAQFVVSIYDHMGIGLFVLHNEIGGGLPEELPSQGSVTCLTDPINLTPGRCVVHLELLRGNVRSDHVPYAASFDVEPDGALGTSLVLPRDWALCLLPHTWQLDRH